MQKEVTVVREETVSVDQTKLRERHKLMEDEKAISYDVMASSAEYRAYYLKYVDFLEEYLGVSDSNDQIDILNVGFASGIMEIELYKKFGDRIRITTIDNSNTFHQIFRRRLSNQEPFDIRMLDIELDEFNFDKKFDLILSRDINHHVSSVSGYLQKVIPFLKTDGMLLMEDLRYDAPSKSISEFINLVFSIPEFLEEDRASRWNLYHKLLGLIESFAVSYTQHEIEDQLRLVNVEWISKLTAARYHFILYNNPKLLDKFETLLKKI